MTVANISTRWIHLGTLILVVVVAIIAGACNGDRPTSPMDKPPFEGLDLLVELSDFSIIGKVEAVSELQAIPHPRDPTSQVEYLETTVEVDRILFGSHHSRVDVHVPVYYLADNGHRMVTKAPILEPGDTAMFFLTRREELPGSFAFAPSRPAPVFTYAPGLTLLQDMGGDWPPFLLLSNGTALSSESGTRWLTSPDNSSSGLFFGVISDPRVALRFPDAPEIVGEEAIGDRSYLVVSAGLDVETLLDTTPLLEPHVRVILSFPYPEEANAQELETLGYEVFGYKLQDSASGRRSKGRTRSASPSGPTVQVSRGTNGTYKSPPSSRGSPCWRIRQDKSSGQPWKLTVLTRTLSKTRASCPSPRTNVST